VIPQPGKGPPHRELIDLTRSGIRIPADQIDVHVFKIRRREHLVHHPLPVSLDERRGRSGVVGDQRIGDPEVEPFGQTQLKRLHRGILPVRIVDEPRAVE
jgi:hypothetical protein